MKNKHNNKRYLITKFIALYLENRNPI